MSGILPSAMRLVKILEPPISRQFFIYTKNHDLLAVFKQPPAE